MNEINLDKFTVDFQKEKGNFYEQYLKYEYTWRQLGEMLGYNSTSTGSGNRAASNPVNKGRYRATRFRLLCIKANINPRKIRKQFQPSITGSHTTQKIVNKETIEAVWKKISDKNDN